MPKGVRSALHALLLAAVFVGSTSLATHHPQAIGASTAWLPSGIAVAGLLVLGRRAAVVLLLAAVGQRLCIDYLPAVAAADALGVTVEGAVGAWLVRRLRPRLELGRLADLLAVFVAAALAPLSSIAVSWLARLAVEPQAAGNFASSWDSWWRMNAIGILLVVPLVLAWRGASARRQAPEAAVWALAAAALTAIVARFAGPGMPAILLLASVLVVAFLAALRLGPRGATADRKSDV